MRARKRTTRQVEAKTVTVYERLKISRRKFSITDLKFINGGAFYADFAKENPGVVLGKIEVFFDNRVVQQFKFPAFFTAKLDAKIFHHFDRKESNLRKFPLEGKRSEK